MKTKVCKWRRWLLDDSAIGTLEIIMIVAVIVVIAIAFRKWIIHWIEKLFASSNEQLNETSNTTVNISTGEQ